MLKSLSVLLAILIAFPSIGHTQDKRVEASVDKTTVTTGEIFTYRIEIEGEFFSPKVILPEFSDWSPQNILLIIIAPHIHESLIGISHVALEIGNGVPTQI